MGIVLTFEDPILSKISDKRLEALRFDFKSLNGLKTVKKAYLQKGGEVMTNHLSF